MAAKLLQSLTDENLDLQKQIGCMTGIFQLFDRQQFLTGGRRIVGHSPNRITAGKSQFSSGAFERDSNNLRSSSLEKYSSKHIQDRQRVFTESSMASFSSSSRSSSFSSIDCNRTTQLEPTSYDRIIFPDTPSRNPTSLHNSSPQLGRQGVDLRDLVKDSMYREVQGFSVKAKSTEEAGDTGSKLRDLGRTKANTGASSHGSLGLEKKPVTPTDLKESLRVLSKLQDSTWHHNEPKLLRSSSYHSKEGSSFSISKDAPRFSYDGREVNRAQDGYVSKSSLKLRDLPRLSLDSREGSMQSLKTDSKASFFVKATQEVDKMSQKLSSGNLARPPSVVAKLMGLETLPDSVSCSDTNMGSSRSYQMEDFDDISRSSVKTDAVKPIQLLRSSSSKNLWKEPTSPRWRNPDPAMKPMSRFPIEPAPWKQTDGMKNSPKPTLRNSRGPAKAPNAFPTVYSEIEKRLKDLEFTQSGKDLRALKQILEAMQVKGLLETEKEGQGSITGHKDQDPNSLSSMHDTRLSSNGKLHSEQLLASTKKKGSGRTFETPIVIMKPSKLVEKSASSVISINGLTKLQNGDSVENSHGLCSVKTADNRAAKSSQRENTVSSSNLKSEGATKTTQNSTNSQQLAKDSNASSAKSSGSTSPRMQQKKVELEKRSKSQTTTSDSSKTRKQVNKQQTESISPGGRRRPKNPSSQQSAEQLTEMRLEPRNSSYNKNENLSHIHPSKSAEAHCSERSPSVSQRESPSANPPSLEDKKLGLNLIEEESSELSCAPREYLSPVSVLDNLVHKDDSHSPVKYTGKPLKVDNDIERNINSVQELSANDGGSSSNESGFTSEVNRKKLQNIDNLVQKLRRLNSSHDEARTDYIASLCENTNPDHRYISEILLASGFLLRDLGSSLKNFQFHSSGHPINPELFLVLEQTKASTFHKEDQSAAGENKTQMMATNKSGRKLIFDAVNEILGRRLATASPSAEPWLSTVKHVKKPLNAQKLLRDLCSEIEGLKAASSKYNTCEEEEDGWKNILCEDVMHRLESWTSFDDETSGVVLDIERSIFKELVGEIVVRESSGSKTKSNKARTHFQSN